MIITLENPNDCDDVDQLREWVLLLQEMVGILRQMESSNKRMVEYSEKIMEQQEQKIALYMHQVELLKERIKQHEIGVTHSYQLRQN